jgi:hypothetical protein
MNQITEVKLTLLDGVWRIEVTKEFAPEYGGGSTVFKRSGGHQIHNALRAAAEMVTLTPSWNPDVDPPASYDYDSDGNPIRNGVNP